MSDSKDSTPAASPRSDSGPAVAAAKLKSIPKRVKKHLRVVLAGDSGVGKTSLIMQAIEDTFEAFPEDIPHTMSFTMENKSPKCRVYVSDIDGREKFASVREKQLTDADVVVLCFDVSNYASFKHIKQHWVGDMPGSPAYVLLGLKSDLRKEKGYACVPIEKAQKLAKAINAEYREISSRAYDSKPCVPFFVDCFVCYHLNLDLCF
jgi:GTPase SAR1 family protein